MEKKLAGKQLLFVTDFQTEEYALNAKWEDFPNEVKEHSRMCGLDLMSALILGCYGKQFEAGEKLAQAMGLYGGINVIGGTATYNLLGAAIAMSHACNSFDIDDGHRQIQGHPGTSFIAGVLSAAYEQDITVREFLRVLTVCYEVTIRWALAMQKEYGFLHSTGAYGAFGTALGIGVIKGLDKEELNNALSIADYHAPMTPVMRAVEYPSMNKDGVPFGALVGTMAYLETICGSTGKTHILEMPKYKEYLDDLGSKYHILDLYFKPFTCCRWAHQPIRACLDLMKEHNFGYREIRHVTVHTFTSAARLSKMKPNNTDEAQYNIAFPIACSLVDGDVGFAQVRDEALKNEAVLQMMDKLDFHVDEDLDKQFPGKRLAYVEITLKNDEGYRSHIYSAPGEPEDPELGTHWIEDKFRRVTSQMLNSGDQETIIGIFANRQDTLVRTLVSFVNKSLIRNI